MAHRPGHFDSTTFRRMKDKFNQEQLRDNDSDIVGGELDLPEFSYRGKDAYNREIQAVKGIGTPYSGDGRKKKYPYLSSQHFATKDIYNPMKSTQRREGVRTIAEERKFQQDRMLSGAFGGDGTTARSLSYFGPEFNKRAEKNAKVANARHDYLTDIALNEGEEALYNALDYRRRGPNKNNVMIDKGRLVYEKFPMKDARADSFRDEYAANPAGLSLRNIHSFEDLSTRAIDTQDEADYYRDYFGKRARRPLKDNYFDTRGGESF